jgi:hypothetical protein
LENDKKEGKIEERTSKQDKQGTYSSGVAMRAVSPTFSDFEAEQGRFRNRKKLKVEESVPDR